MTEIDRYGIFFAICVPLIYAAIYSYLLERRIEKLEQKNDDKSTKD